MKQINKGVRRNTGYFTALGRFVHTFSATETLMRAMLRRLLGLTPDVANVILGSPPAQSAMERISQLLHAQRRSDELINAFRSLATQLGYINANRNLILHHGTFRGDRPGDFIASNAPVARSAGSQKILPVSVKILVDMTDDLDKINAHLTLMTARLKNPAAEPKAKHAALMLRAFVYKPPKQGSQR